MSAREEDQLAVDIMQRLEAAYDERREEHQLQMRSERQRSRISLRPAPLSLEGCVLVEQPRISPLPPTPQKSSTRKRKEPPAVVEEKTPHFQKKRIRLKVRSPTTPVARRVKLDVLAITMDDQGANKKKEIFPFLELPGEIRNMIYQHCIAMMTQQALLVHLPKTGTLRASTRQSRAAPGKYREPDDLEKKTKNGVVKQLPPQASHRPFVGLTHVCQQIRKEFYPMYIGKQEVGLDLTQTTQYLETFFNPHQPLCFADNLDLNGKNLPFRGNLTIAVADKILPVEKMVGWIDALPFLYTWANSFQIEAGFGRYSRRNYQPSVDGEAKDLYRLYGRKVLQDRTCGPMNQQWRIVLRRRQLAAVRIHREGNYYGKPFFHIIWKHEHRKYWMTDLFSDIPGTLHGVALAGSWLAQLGFDGMEHFHVRVGAERRPNELS